MKYNGTRWHKCDFHLHTTASDCFFDKSVTPEDWVAKVIEVGLNCVAITDHNTGAGINDIQNAAKDTNLTIFPGVEITCDTSKVHLLILFNIDKKSTDIEDFLISCDIKRENFGKKDAHTSKTILEISKIANDNSCLIIPAHIDGYSGLGDISYSILQKFFKLEYINAVQMIHKEFLDTSLIVQDNSEIKTVMDTYYNQNIDYTTISNWQAPMKIAIENKKSLLTFSDNPHSEVSSQHGLWGIGNNYSWIKMDEKPTLESLRQAFLLPELRVKNSFESLNIPYTLPSLWIKSVSIDETKVTENGSSFNVNFSPQLTTVIGGRGSGKSSILRFLRGVFSKNIDASLNSIYEDQIDFYKKPDRTGKGVLTDNSKIEVIFIRNDIEYKINVSNIKSHNEQNVEIKKYDNMNNEWVLVSEPQFIYFFDCEHYSQKQIYEIAQKPNSLCEKIDSATENMDSLKYEKDVLFNQYLEKSSQIRTIQKEISGKGKLQTEIKDIKDQIELYKKSKIADLLKERSKYIENRKEIKEFHDNLLLKEELLHDFIEQFNIPPLSVEKFDENYKSKILEFHTSISKIYTETGTHLKSLEVKVKQSREDFMSEVKTSDWNIAFKKHSDEFILEKDRLKKEGLEDIENFEILTKNLEIKEAYLLPIVEKETKLEKEIQLINEIHNQYISKLEEITTSRKGFVASTIIDEKLQIKINSFRNKENFESSLRSIIQKDTGFYDEIHYLQNECFNGLVKNKMIDFRNIINRLRSDESVVSIGGHFKNLITKLDDAQIDKLMLLMPEDEIEVKYKPTSTSPFKSLSTASAGQKTTAILTFILSYGNNPLILDQPEDDLDNRLVYDLIVDRLKKAKANRQIIVVTHNANIPVNGDAEYIISMDSESKYLKVLTSGSVDKSDIKKEICDVMEGSEAAFNMRSQRYKEI